MAQRLFVKPKGRDVRIQRHLLAICENDPCRAVLLDFFEYWTGSNLDQGKDPVVRISIPQMSKFSLGLYGNTKIRESLEWLAKQGMLQRGEVDISETQNRATPYTLVEEEVNRRIAGLPPSENGGPPPPKTEAPPSENGGPPTIPRARAAFSSSLNINHNNPQGGNDKPKTPYAEQGAFEHFLGAQLRLANLRHEKVSDKVRAFLGRLDEQAADREAFRAGLVEAILAHSGTGNTLSQDLGGYGGLAKDAPRRQSAKSTHRTVAEATRETRLGWIREFEEKEAAKRAQKQ